MSSVLLVKSSTSTLLICLCWRLDGCLMNWLSAVLSWCPAAQQSCLGRLTVCWVAATRLIVGFNDHCMTSFLNKYLHCLQTAVVIVMSAGCYCDNICPESAKWNVGNISLLPLLSIMVLELTLLEMARLQTAWSGGFTWPPSCPLTERHTAYCVLCAHFHKSCKEQ